MERGAPLQVGFELGLFARVPADVSAGPERQAAIERIWDRLRDVAESLLPLAGAEMHRSFARLRERPSKRSEPGR
jgi:hypothetical protein